MWKNKSEKVDNFGKDMTMTEEDKQLIAGYMGWKIVMVGQKKSPYPIYVDNINPNIHHRFDLNDASLCVAEMQKRGDVGSFIQFSWGLKTIYPERRNSLLEYIPYIFNAENFFNAMSEWLEEKVK